MTACPLCNHNSLRKEQPIHDILFKTCDICGTLYKHSQHYVDAANEKLRYLAHHNDVADANFQKFVSPMVNAITDNFTKEAIGLDFGAGTAPVVTKLLNDKGFNRISLYDPFFYPEKSFLETTYDFIICCEVMEHFHNPCKEFKLLHSLLKPNGKLFCMTGLLPSDIELKDWWYIRDSTHVVFYSEENLYWIQENFGFKKMEISGSLITFTR